MDCNRGSGPWFGDGCASNPGSRPLLTSESLERALLIVIPTLKERVH
jgi:hypothetical protein